MRAVDTGRAKVVLVSGDAHGISAQRIVQDGAGLDTYDTCRRAHDVFGIRKALLASQEFHLHRAVALCRSLGIDAEGLAAPCADCRESTLLSNRMREVPAAWKALLDRVRHRQPAVVSPPTTAVAAALAG